MKKIGIILFSMLLLISNINICNAKNMYISNILTRMSNHETINNYPSLVYGLLFDETAEELSLNDERLPNAKNYEGYANTIIAQYGLNKGTDAEKVYKLAKYIQNNIKYDLSLLKSKDRGQSMDSFFKTKHAICAGTAMAATYILDKVNVECIPYWDTKNVHAFNYVKIDGKWYFCDFTPLTDDTDISLDSILTINYPFDEIGNDIFKDPSFAAKYPLADKDYNLINIVAKDKDFKHISLYKTYKKKGIKTYVYKYNKSDDEETNKNPVYIYKKENSDQIIFKNKGVYYKLLKDGWSLVAYKAEKNKKVIKIPSRINCIDIKYNELLTNTKEFEVIKINNSILKHQKKLKKIVIKHSNIKQKLKFKNIEYKNLEDKIIYAKENNKVMLPNSRRAKWITKGTSVKVKKKKNVYYIRKKRKKIEKIKLKYNHNTYTLIIE